MLLMLKPMHLNQRGFTKTIVERTNNNMLISALEHNDNNMKSHDNDKGHNF